MRVAAAGGVNDGAGCVTFALGGGGEALPAIAVPIAVAIVGVGCAGTAAAEAGPPAPVPVVEDAPLWVAWDGTAWETGLTVAAALTPGGDLSVLCDVAAPA